MESHFILSRLKAVASAVSQIELHNNTIKNEICVLLGYLRADDELSIPLEGGQITQQTYEETETVTVLEFTQQEISKMPKQFRKIFKTNGVHAHVRKRYRNGSLSYEIRFRAAGHNISASGTTLEEAKERFNLKLENAQNETKPTAPGVPKEFDKFILYYFETFRKRKVNPATYKKDISRLNTHIIPYFGSIALKDISPPICQQLIDKIVSEGKGKTAEEVFTLLNITFKTAIKHNLIQHNPMDIVIRDKYESEHGKALTVDEEKLLLSSTSGNMQLLFAIALYTGLRPNEYPTARIVGDMIIARNSKRHNGKEETKRIPISPMLRPYITDETVIPIIGIDTIRRAFTKIFGKKHKLYDLRTTFYTRCQMCGVAPAARDEFVGHSSGELTNAYTDLPDDYLKKEAEKLNY